MKGKIKFYNESKGFGFIVDEKGKDRFFHVSSVKSLVPIERGSKVEFTPSQNEKGLTAIDIMVHESLKPTFIQLGNTRIKLTNIKNYGMKKDYDVLTRPVETETGNKFIDGVVTFLSIASAITGGEVCKEEYKEYYDILYVTTYQNDNFEFSEKDAGFNIHKKFKELDQLLS